MSDVPQHISLSRQLTGRWQIPLLLVSLGLLMAGVWRLRPAPKPPTFEELFTRSATLKDAKLYSQASRHIESVLSNPELKLSVLERGRLQALMAEVIYLHELGNAVHGAGNARSILSNLDWASAAGVADSVDRQMMRARACEWLNRGAEAVEAYRRALAGGVADPWAVRKRIVQIDRESGRIAGDQLQAELDPFLAGDDVPDEMRYWALEQKVVLLGEEQKYQEADALLASQSRRPVGENWRNQREFLQALVAYHLGRSEEAEPLLRVLRDRVVPGDPLYARASWLLGRILQSHEAPQPALSFYDDVLSKTTPGPYYTLSMLGRAETLAALERYGESAETYHEVLRQVTNQPYDNQVDLQVVRQSTTQLYEQLRASRNYKESMAYLRIASPLAPAGDARLQAIYTERLADLAYALGEQVLARSRRQVGDDGLAEAKAAREAFIESAEAYLRLAKLTMTNEGASSAAAWRAAEALDLAGEYERRTEVLEAFIRERPGDVRVPEALLRLGQTYQAMGARDRAIGAYQRNLIDYPRTYWAVRCLVPLAECFIDSRQMDKAEQTLLRIVDREPTEAVALIRPEAQEYRDALFRLGDLYLQSGQYEKAIGRFEEALQRYPEDKRSDRVAFLMADAYRRSAAQIRTDLEDPQKVAFKDELTVQHQERLKRAEELFARVIERYRNRPADLLSDLDTTCLKMSHFYRADSIYDRSRLTDPSDIEPLVQSLRRYDEAAWLYQSDPIAMSAFVQIINCHLRMGNIVEARRALQRAGWALRNIPEDRFDASVPGGSKDFWEKYLSWLGRAPMLAAKTEG